MYRDIFSFSSWTTLIALAQRFILNITPTILGAVAGSASIALFSIGMVIEGYVWTISSAIGSLFLPKVTRMTTSNRHADLENLLIKVGRIQLYIVGLIIVGFMTMGQEFIRLWVGESFHTSYWVALLLIVPGFITLTQEIAYTTLIATNQIKYRAFASMIVALVSVILSSVLSPHYGAIGAAVAILIGNFFGTILFMNWVYQRILQLNMWRFFKECHIKIMPALITLGAAGWVVQQAFPVDSLFLFLVKAGLLGGGYLLVLWLFTFREDEKQLITGLLRRSS
ncbi:MAG: polysaccharide biosynthesis C-terminal domain-containing protein, partial [Exiguobacterium marinum]|uniref:lipopolysaccharide biosynthesis protein n=1 Tax=Exiguobacterium marinum TaxID=273528 RepID=UPI003C5FDA9F